MNDNKIPLHVIGISFSSKPLQACVLLVEEQHGQRRIPVVIGIMEGKVISLQIEHRSSPRPLTHDLFFTVSKAFGIEILEVNIVKLEDGIFYSELLCYNGEKQVSISSRTSDAIALALYFRCPIFTTEEIMEKAGVVHDEQIKSENTSNKDESANLSGKSINELNELLMIAVTSEDYEAASKIRDEIKKREKSDDDYLFRNKSTITE